MLESGEQPKTPGMVFKIWIALKGISYVEVIFILFWIKERLITFKLQRNKTRNRSSNIKDTLTERFLLQMPVLHQTKCISNADSSSLLRDGQAKYKDKLPDLSDSHRNIGTSCNS